MNLQDVIATFGSVERARERLRLQAGPVERARERLRLQAGPWSIEERNTATALALLGLDSLAADPEREASMVTKPAYADLWVAINEIVAASGGNPACMNVSRQRSVVKVNAALRALLRPAPPSPSAVADQIVRDVAELPDRDSPEDWPEAMLVTGDELRAIVLAALAASNANARGGE